MSGEGGESFSDTAANLAEEARDLQTPERTKGPDRTGDFVLRPGKHIDPDARVTRKSDRHSGRGTTGAMIAHPSKRAEDTFFRRPSTRPGDSRWNRNAVSYDTSKKRA